MSDIISGAVEALAKKLPDGFAGGTAKFVIEGEGAIMVDSEGVRAGDDEADVTLTATADIFEGMMSGDVDPTSAFMQGNLKLDGEMGMAMQLGSALA